MYSKFFGFKEILELILTQFDDEFYANNYEIYQV